MTQGNERSGAIDESHSGKDEEHFVLELVWVHSVLKEDGVD